MDVAQEPNEPTADRRIRRRAFLAAGAGGAAALALPSWVSKGVVELAAAATPRPFRKRLRIPNVLSGSQLTIPMRQASFQVLPGRRTKMWTYAGSFPGPTIRRRSGEATSVKFQHRLPSSAGELTVHLHGGHNRSTEDGQPGWHTNPKPAEFYCKLADVPAPENGNGLLIKPQGERTYQFEGFEDGAPERSAFQWYHDHRCEATAKNVWMGLAGMWIVDDDLDNPEDGILAGLSGPRDIPLMICDRQFDRRNRLTDPFAQHRRPPLDHVTGKHVLVNGVIKPYHPVQAQQYRLRLLNASNFRSYNVAFTGGVTMVQVASESGLIPVPLNRGKIFIGPGERVEVVADFAGARGKRVELRSVKRPGSGALGAKPYEGALMQFRVGDDAVTDPFELPGALRELPDWVAEAQAQWQASGREPDETWRIQVGGGLRPAWTINGKTYDPSFAETTVESGQIAIWKLTNMTDVVHLMHLHHTDWYMLERNGATPPAHERCLKETFYLGPRESVVVAGKITSDPTYAGKYIVHCHMLDHEDHGLMSQFEVVAPASP